MSHDRYIFGCCNNDKRWLKYGKIVFHELRVNQERPKAWTHEISKRREDFQKPKHFKVFPNHIPEGKPTKCNPNSTLFLKISTNALPATTKPRPPPKNQCVSSSLANVNESPLQLFVNSTAIVPNSFFRTFVADDLKHALFSRKSTEMQELLIDENKNKTNLYSEKIIIPLRFNQIVLLENILFFNGLDDPAVFEALFEYVKVLTKHLH